MFIGGTDGDALTMQKYYRIEFVRVLNKLIMDTISVSSDLFVKGYKFLEKKLRAGGL